MPKLRMKVEAVFFTTRQGDHPDDKLYFKQKSDEAQRKLEASGWTVKDLSIEHETS